LHPIHPTSELPGYPHTSIDIEMASLIQPVEPGISTARSTTRRYPLELKIALTLFVVFTDPVCFRAYGPWNFLWFCCLALHLTVVALWLENRLLLSMQTVGIVTIQFVWILDYLGRLFLGFCPFGLVHYVFIRSHPVLHALTLFHIWFPLLLLFVVRKTGYDRRAMLFQIPVFWFVLLICILFGPPHLNINLTTQFMDLSFAEKIATFPVSKQASEILSRYIDWRHSLPAMAVWAMDLTYILALGPLVLLLPPHLVLVRYFCKKPARQAEPSASSQASLSMRIRGWFWEYSPRALQPGFPANEAKRAQNRKFKRISKLSEYQPAPTATP
jgi:hypothetical protein